MNKETLIKKTIVWFYDFNKIRQFNKKAKKIISLQTQVNSWKKPSRELVLRHKALWQKLSHNVKTDCLKIYGNITGDWDYRFIPESIYYSRIEPCLNNKAFAKCYTDKNSYSFFLKEFKFPETIISNIEGVFYNNKFETISGEQVKNILDGQDRFIIKPAVDSGGGKSVSLWVKKDGVFVSDEGGMFNPGELFKKYNKNFIIQEAIHQHPFYSKFNSTSVNTVRILTYRSVKDNQIHLLHCILRVGASGKITDNQASGGFACGVTDDGFLTGKAVDKYGNRYSSVNGIMLEKGIRLEGIDELMTIAKAVASKYYYSRLLGFDLCVDENNNSRIIEVNNLNNEINFFQMLNGSLFKEFTDEVVSYCANEKRSFMIDYEI